MNECIALKSLKKTITQFKKRKTTKLNELKRLILNNEGDELDLIYLIRGIAHLSEQIYILEQKAAKHYEGDN